MGYVTVPDLETAKSLARGLVESKRVACANILPSMYSIYEWDGTVEESSEVLLLVKTLAELCDQVQADLASAHPYECPCIVWLDLAGGHDEFLEWVRGQVPSGE